MFFFLYKEQELGVDFIREVMERDTWIGKFGKPTEDY